MTNQNQDHHHQPLRILCTDDNAELVELIAESLQHYGYRVEWVFDGAEAIKLLAADPAKFDLLITDMQMPRLDGHDLIVQSRALGFRGKIIVFAGALTAQDRERLGSLSVEAIIDKPANHRQLIGVVARLQTELWEQSNADAA
jgi:CheY-like chemotaxis protein